MKVSEILSHIDSGYVALPTFQRGYVWKRGQVRSLMDSLYRRHPVGSLLVWVTPANNVKIRGEQDPPPNMVILLLDGQQRVTSLYGIIRGEAPVFFDGDDRAFKGLHFHLPTEEFRFHQPVMNDDPLWIDVSDLMQRGHDWMDTQGSDVSRYSGRIMRLLGIRDIDLHEEKIVGEENIDVVVDLFNRVNSSGTRLSQGDLALAKICASWPDGRKVFNAKLEKWKKDGYEFKRDWLLRNVNAILTGKASFVHLDNETPTSIQDGLARAERSINYALNLINDRLGLDDSSVLFAHNVLPVMSRYIDQRDGRIESTVEQNRLLYWYFSSGMWGRFSEAIETVINQDLDAISNIDDGVDRLIEQLWRSHQTLRIRPEDFEESTAGARFYRVLYALTRTSEARDLGSGIVLKRGLLGNENALERHHIFPRAQLKRTEYNQRAHIHALANFCWLTRETNRKIGARLPRDYFREIDPDLLKSQWIPTDDEELWEIHNYPQFLEARRNLLAKAANELLDTLSGGPPTPATAPAVIPVSQPVVDVPEGGESEDEEAVLAGVREWVSERGLAQGQVGYELAHPETRDPLARLDIAWPDGLQEGLTDPVALLLDEEAATLQVVVNDHRFRPFTSVDAFKRYVETDVLEPDKT